MKVLDFLLLIATFLLVGRSLSAQELQIEPDEIIIDSTIFLDGSGVADGGQILIRNKGNDNRIRLFSQLNTGTNDGGFIDLWNRDNVRTMIINGNDVNDGGRVILYSSDGAQQMVLNSSFNNSGDSRIITDEIEIRGGSDLSEMFDVTDDEAAIVPGLLVSLDPRNPGKLRICNEAYDKKLAGIISGANGIKPGILMGQENTIAHGDELVTLSGRVYVKANTSNGAIKVGDAITSSDISGEAMRVTKKKKARGAIVGKALTGLDQESGYILVLVNLQ